MDTTSNNTQHNASSSPSPLSFPPNTFFYFLNLHGRFCIRPSGSAHNQSPYFGLQSDTKRGKETAIRAHSRPCLTHTLFLCDGVACDSQAESSRTTRKYGGTGLVWILSLL